LRRPRTQAANRLGWYLLILYQPSERSRESERQLPIRTNVYVDGFNLYYGALRSSPYRWLNLLKLSEGLLRTDNVINRIRYFTARVTPRKDDLTVTERQAAFLRAISTIPNLSVHFGLFLTNEAMMPRADGSGTVKVLKTEEKGSDVNLASFLLLDACDRDFETALVVSNDSDLVVPLQEARRRYGVKIGISCPVLTPRRWPNRELVEASDFNVHLTSKRRRLLRDSQFPDELSDESGVFRKSEGW
jgi:hypothetical protein